MATAWATVGARAVAKTSASSWRSGGRPVGKLAPGTAATWRSLLAPWRFECHGRDPGCDPGVTPQVRPVTRLGPVYAPPSARLGFRLTRDPRRAIVGAKTACRRVDRRARERWLNGSAQAVRAEPSRFNAPRRARARIATDRRLVQPGVDPAEARQQPGRHPAEAPLPAAAAGSLPGLRRVAAGSACPGSYPWQNPGDPWRAAGQRRVDP